MSGLTVESTPSKALVGAILRSPYDLDWSVQGLGMLRTYLDKAKVYRLHIWDGWFKIPGVSPIHDHPWDMMSTILAGRLYQYRYTLQPGRLPPGVGRDYQMATIKCGEDTCITVAPQRVVMTQGELEEYGPDTDKGDCSSYSQKHDEIHQSLPVDGTVTLVRRIVPDGGDPDHARVFWEGTGPFVDAEPRKATKDEIAEGVASALQWW